MLSIALRHFEVSTTATLHYETWFGDYNKGLMNTVASMYSKIDGGPITARYDTTTCSDASIYAWVTSDE